MMWSKGKWLLAKKRMESTGNIENIGNFVEWSKGYIYLLLFDFKEISDLENF